MSVVVARIGKPHGLRGEVTVQLHTDDPEARFAVGTVIATAGRRRDRRAADADHPRRPACTSGIWLLGFEEIPDRTGAESPAGHPAGRRRRGPRRPTATRPGTRTSSSGSRRATTARSRLGEVTGLEIGPRPGPARRHARPTASTPTLPFVERDRPRGRRRRAAASSSTRRPGPARPRRRDVTRVGHARRRRLDLPRLPRAARPVAHRQGARATGCSTCASTTCATSPTTGTAPSTTPPTAAERAWS